MNSYKLSDIKVGLTESFSQTITEAALDKFREISGDINPLHTDTEFAKAHGFDSKVVFGMLTTSLYSTLVGVYLPGEHCLLQQVSVKFKKPVFVNDTLTVIGTVSEVNDTFRRVIIKAKTVNQHGITVNSATIVTGIID